jgi:hypothetical protein
MTLDEAKVILATSVREELRDRAFGDAEVYWIGRDGGETASGYFGSDAAEVQVGGTVFTGGAARELREFGKRGRVERNDSIGRLCEGCLTRDCYCPACGAPCTVACGHDAQSEINGP